MDASHFKPVNSTAKQVVQKGVHYDVEVKEKTHQGVPHSINKYLNPSSYMFIDYSGHKHGYFTIHKYIGNSKWSCRCSCGDYEIRSTKSIKKHITNKGKIDVDMCYSCHNNRKIRHALTAKSMGYEYEEYMHKFFSRRKPVEGN